MCCLKQVLTLRYRRIQLMLYKWKKLIKQQKRELTKSLPNSKKKKAGALIGYRQLIRYKQQLKPGVKSNAIGLIFKKRRTIWNLLPLIPE